MGGSYLQGSARGWLLTAFVSNGNGTSQVLEYLTPWVDLYKIDLKSFDDRHYRQLAVAIAADELRKIDAY
jgi:pyruvate formate lyase activating enzyme